MPKPKEPKVEFYSVPIILTDKKLMPGPDIYRSLITMPGCSVLSENEIRSMSWQARAEQAKRERNAMRVFATIAGVPKMDPKRPRKVHLKVHHFRMRSLDDDNLIGGFKAYRDGLKARRPKLPKDVKVKLPPDGWIVDDNRKWLTVEHVETLVKNQYEVEIIVEYFVLEKS